MSDTFITLCVRVTPRAVRSEIFGFDGAVWKVRLKAPPVDRAANLELVKLLAKHFDVSKSDVEIVSGVTSRKKVIRIFGRSDGDLAGEAKRFLP